MAKSEQSKTPAEILSEITEPETGKSLMESRMVKSIEQEGKKVKVELVPLSSGCAACRVMHVLLREVEEKLREHNYEPEVEFVIE